MGRYNKIKPPERISRVLENCARFEVQDAGHEYGAAEIRGSARQDAAREG